MSELEIVMALGTLFVGINLARQARKAYEAKNWAIFWLWVLDIIALLVMYLAVRFYTHGRTL